MIEQNYKYVARSKHTAVSVRFFYFVPVASSYKQLQDSIIFGSDFKLC